MSTGETRKGIQEALQRVTDLAATALERGGIHVRGATAAETRANIRNRHRRIQPSLPERLYQGLVRRG